MGRKYQRETRFKVLPLPSWVKSKVGRKDLETYYQHTAPIYNRDGWYLQAGACWLEIDGKAYATNTLADSFAFELAMLNVKPLRDLEYKALNTLKLAKLLNRNGLKKLEEYDTWRKLREQEKYFGIAGMQARQRLNAFIQTRLHKHGE